MRALALVVLTTLLASAGGGVQRASVAAKGTPGVLTAVAPEFPEAAAAAAISMSFTVHVEIGADGLPTRARMEPSFRVFQDAVESAARAWRFTAAEVSPSTRRVDLRFVFKIIPSTSSPAEAVTLFRPPYEVEVRRPAVPVPPGPTVQ